MYILYSYILYKTVLWKKYGQTLGASKLCPVLHGCPSMTKKPHTRHFCQSLTLFWTPAENTADNRNSLGQGQVSYLVKAQLRQHRTRIWGGKNSKTWTSPNSIPWNRYKDLITEHKRETCVVRNPSIPEAKQARIAIYRPPPLVIQLNVHSPYWSLWKWRNNPHVLTPGNKKGGFALSISAISKATEGPSIMGDLGACLDPRRRLLADSM